MREKTEKDAREAVIVGAAKSNKQEKGTENNPAWVGGMFVDRRLAVPEGPVGVRGEKWRLSLVRGSARP